MKESIVISKKGVRILNYLKKKSSRNNILINEKLIKLTHEISNRSA